MLVVEIEGTFCARQIRLKGKEYLVKYKGCHHKEVIWMKFVHLDHLLEMVNKFQKKNRDPLASKQSVDEDINF
jgi:hypothetical protein